MRRRGALGDECQLQVVDDPVDDGIVRGTLPWRKRTSGPTGRSIFSGTRPSTYLQERDPRGLRGQRLPDAPGRRRSTIIWRKDTARLPGNEQTLRNYIGYLIETDGLRLDETAAGSTRKVPELPFGKQMQLDFGRYRCRSGLRLYIFAALLSASRYKYVIFQGKPFRTLDVIRHLLDAFRLFWRPARGAGDRPGPADGGQRERRGHHLYEGF